MTGLNLELRWHHFLVAIRYFCYIFRSLYLEDLDHIPVIWNYRLLQCPIEWFHFACVGLTSKPKGKWFCKRCVASGQNKLGKKKKSRLGIIEKYASASDKSEVDHILSASDSEWTLNSPCGPCFSFQDIVGVYGCLCTRNYMVLFDKYCELTYFLELTCTTFGWGVEWRIIMSKTSVFCKMDVPVSIGFVPFYSLLEVCIATGL